MKKIFIILLVSLFATAANSKENKSIEWVVQPSIGYNFPVPTLNKGYITDNLISFESPTYYWKFISIAYFFSDLGVEFSYTANHSSNFNDRHKLFADDVKTIYSKDYFLETDPGVRQTDLSKIIFGSIQKGSIGPIYKIEMDEFIIIVRAMVGTISFDTDIASSKLKEKGTNERINIDWRVDKQVTEFFTFNPSVTFGFRLNERFILNLDLNYWIYNIDFEYKETITNLNTNEVQTKTYPYSSQNNEMSIGIGMMIIVK